MIHQPQGGAGIPAKHSAAVSRRQPLSAIYTADGIIVTDKERVVGSEDHTSRPCDVEQKSECARLVDDSVAEET